MIHGDDDLDVAQLRANDVVQASISKAMTGLHEGSNWKLLKDTLFEEVAAEYKWPICLSIAKLELIAICIQLVGKKSTHGDSVHDLIKLKPRVDENVDGKEFVKAQRGVLKRLARTIEKILSRSQHRVQLSLGADAICGEAIFAADIQADIDKLRQKRRVKASSVEAYAGKVVAHVPHMTGAALAECLQAFKPTAKGVVLQCQILLTAFEAKEMPIAPVLSYWLLMVGLARKLDTKNQEAIKAATLEILAVHGSMSDPNLYKNRSDKFTERMVKLLKRLMADEQASNEFRNVITKFIFRTVEERGIV